MNTRSTNKNRVVACIDGSEDGQRALRYAVELAERRGAGLRLVHVPHEYVPMNPVLPLIASSTLTELGTSLLEHARREADEMSGGALDVEVALASGPRAAAILEHTDDASAIVLGTRHPGLRRVLTGSTTTAIAARAECPVYCVPPSWTPGHSSHRVLVGVDGSAASDAVLDHAYGEADPRSATLIVAHAWRPSDYYDHAIGTHRIETDWEASSRRNLAELVAGRAADFPDVKVDLLLAYDWPADVLEHASREVDLLVLGRRGHGGVLGRSVGSISRAMVRAGHCPVVVVPVAD